MHVLVMASQKGGSGKTTLSGHLAVEAERAGVGPVALIDTDPQGSLAQWWNARAASSPYFAKSGPLELGEALAHLKSAGIKFAVIDTPPAITGSISQVVAHADLVVVPTRPSPHDLRAVGATVDIAERHGKPLIFVVNAATARARITGEAAVALSQHGTVAPVTVHHRVDFAASMVDGRTVGEVVPKSQSTKEISDLWLYIQDRLSRLKADSAFLPDVKAQHLAVSPLSSLSNGNAFEDSSAEPALDDAGLAMGGLQNDLPNSAPAPSAPNVYGPGGLERRSGMDRRDGQAPAGFGSNGLAQADRRKLPFGRRHTDRVF
ncbi:MAG: ParA family protein [Proteobacteria bacterium]|nr:ParA family protein [Pseudomonadota bacterium]